VKVTNLETLFCDAGWRPWIFLKATADDGSVGWAEITDSHGSPRGLAGIVEDLAPLVVAAGLDLAAVAHWYGAEVPLLCPAEYATATSPGIEWLALNARTAGGGLRPVRDVRASNPFRGPETVAAASTGLLATPEANSVRAVELAKQHPGKTWVCSPRTGTMPPLLEQSHLDVVWHAGQYQALPPIYVQTSALETACTRVVAEAEEREGRVVAPFLTEATRLQRGRRGGLGAGRRWWRAGRGRRPRSRRKFRRPRMA